MKKLVCCTSNYSVGCTFLDWSIHFLSGQDKFFSVDKNTWIDLINNPLNILNAHGHQKNHPSGFDSTKKFVEIFVPKTKILFDLMKKYIIGKLSIVVVVGYLE